MKTKLVASSLGLFLIVLSFGTYQYFQSKNCSNFKILKRDTTTTPDYKIIQWDFVRSWNPLYNHKWNTTVKVKDLDTNHFIDLENNNSTFTQIRYIGLPGVQDNDETYNINFSSFTIAGECEEDYENYHDFILNNNNTGDVSTLGRVLLKPSKMPPPLANKKKEYQQQIILANSFDIEEIHLVRINNDSDLRVSVTLSHNMQIYKMELMPDSLSGNLTYILKLVKSENNQENRNNTVELVIKNIYLNRYFVLMFWRNDFLKYDGVNSCYQKHAAFKLNK